MSAAAAPAGRRCSVCRPEPGRGRAGRLGRDRAAACGKNVRSCRCNSRGVRASHGADTRMTACMGCCAALQCRARGSRPHYCARTQWRLGTGGRWRAAGPARARAPGPAWRASASPPRTPRCSGAPAWWCGSCAPRPRDALPAANGGGRRAEARAQEARAHPIRSSISLSPPRTWKPIVGRASPSSWATTEPTVARILGLYRHTCSGAGGGGGAPRAPEGACGAARRRRSRRACGMASSCRSL